MGLWWESHCPHQFCWYPIQTSAMQSLCLATENQRDSDSYSQLSRFLLGVVIIWWKEKNVCGGTNGNSPPHLQSPILHFIYLHTCYTVKQWAFHPFFTVFFGGGLLGVLTLHRNNRRGHLALFFGKMVKFLFFKVESIVPQELVYIKPCPFLIQQSYAESSMCETPTPVWVRCRHLYGWDTNTCMGEIPQQLCEVIQAAYGSRETFR